MLDKCVLRVTEFSIGPDGLAKLWRFSFESGKSGYTVDAGFEGGRDFLVCAKLDIGCAFAWLDAKGDVGEETLLCWCGNNDEFLCLGDPPDTGGFNGDRDTADLILRGEAENSVDCRF